MIFVADYGQQVYITPKTPLMLFETTVGNSFRCDPSQSQNITDLSSNEGLSVELSKTQWEAFGIQKSGEFNKG